MSLAVSPAPPSRTPLTTRVRHSCFSNLSHYSRVAKFTSLLSPTLTPISTNSATATTTLGRRRTSRRTNDGAGAHTTSSVPDIAHDRFAPAIPEAPGAPAGHRRTNGRAADGYSPAATAPPGASAGSSSASKFSPRPPVSTTRPPRPVPNTGGSSEQPNVLQGAYHPHRYQGAFLSNAPYRPRLP